MIFPVIGQLVIHLSLKWKFPFLIWLKFTAKWGKKKPEQLSPMIHWNVKFFPCSCWLLPKLNRQSKPSILFFGSTHFAPHRKFYSSPFNKLLNVLIKLSIIPCFILSLTCNKQHINFLTILFYFSRDIYIIWASN